MLNIFRLVNIINKIQLNIYKYDLLIYHITKRLTTETSHQIDNLQNIISLPITTILTSSSSSSSLSVLSTSSLFYPYHKDIFEKAIFSSANDLIICQILSANILNSSSTTNFSCDYITELNDGNQHQEQQHHQKYNENFHHHQRLNNYQNINIKEIFCKNYKVFSRLLNLKEFSCLNKYYINNSLNLNKLIKRNMSTIATTPTTDNSADAIESNGDAEIIKNDSSSNKIINNLSNELIESNSNGDTIKNGVKNIEENDKSSCFTSSLADIIQFLELVGGLKHTKRTGWILRDIKDCESISGHMYRMSMMTFLLNGSEGLNQIRCMELALVHDLAESIVGDLTPFCGVSKEDKKKREMDAMENICNLIQPRGERMWKLFQEYEAAETPESKFVKDLDRLDLVLQAFEYEKRDNCVMKHQEFFDSNEGKFDHPFVKKLVDEIYEQRKELANKLGATTEMYVEKQPNGHSSSSSGECPEDLSQKKLTTTS